MLFNHHRHGILRLLIACAMTLACMICVQSAAAAGCCTTPGDADGNGIVNIADPVYMTQYFFLGASAPACTEQWDVDASGTLNIVDISRIVLFVVHASSTLNCGPSVITSQERSIALSSIDSIATLLDGVGPDSLAAALVAFLNSRDEYEAVGQEGTSVWARFDDGRMVMIPNNRFTDEPIDSNLVEGALEHAPLIPETRINLGPLDESRSEKQSYDLPSKATIAPSYGLPNSVKAFCVSTLGNNCFQPGATYAGQLLENQGYELFPYSTVTISDLWQRITDYGFFYIDSHGGVCEARGGQFITGIWTSEPWSTAGDQAFATDLDSARLVYMYAKGASGSGCTNQWRYAFTGKFVEEYMTFSQNSLVYISACYSDAPSLRAGFTAAGASVYMGWTMPVTALWSNLAGVFLVDRMLGANVYPVMEHPKQRPFDIVQVYQDLKNRGWDWDHITASELRITELDPGFGLLAPSLRFAYIINFTDTLFLTGYFGADPGNKGHVYVDGVEQTVYKWEPTFIWASIPRSGAGSAGAITVEVEPLVGPSASSGKKRKSNPINLTKWYGLFEYTVKDAGSLEGTISFWCGLRADLHSFREAPHTTPAPNPFIVFGGDLDSYAWGKATGVYNYTIEYDPPPNDECTWTWKGSTPDIPCVPYNVGGVDNPFGTFLLQGSIDAPTKLMELMVMGTAGGQMLMAESLYCSLSGLVSASEIVLSPPFDLYDILPFNFSVNFDANWNIAGEVNSWSTCCSKDPNNDGSVNDVLHKMEWLSIPVSFAPDSTAPQ